MNFAERKAIFQSNKGPQGAGAGVCKGDAHTNRTVSPPRSAHSPYGCGTNITPSSDKSQEGSISREKVKDTSQREREAQAEKCRVMAVKTISSRRGVEEPEGGGTGAMSVKDIISSWSSVVKETSVLRGKVKTRERDGETEEERRELGLNAFYCRS
jgi:hypothetical protein